MRPVLSPLCSEPWAARTHLAVLQTSQPPPTQVRGSCLCLLAATDPLRASCGTPFHPQRGKAAAPQHPLQVSPRFPGLQPPAAPGLDVDRERQHHLSSGGKCRHSAPPAQRAELGSALEQGFSKPSASPAACVSTSKCERHRPRLHTRPRGRSRCSLSCA